VTDVGFFKGTRLDRISEAVHDKLADASVLRLLGRPAIAEHEQSRRVVWVNEPSRVEPAKATGGTRVASASGVGDDRIRKVYTRQQVLSLHIYAEDAEQTEILFDGMLAAMHLAYGAGIIPGSYEWESERADIAGNALRQPKIRLEIVVMMPVSDEAKGLRTIDQFIHGHPAGDNFNHS